MTIIPSKDEFLDLANKGCRSRLAESRDYTKFCEAMRSAYLAAAKSALSYAEGSAGTEGCYRKYVGQTSAWAVWVDPVTFHVLWLVGRASVLDFQTLPLYPGGRKQYLESFWSTRSARYTEESQVLACKAQYKVVKKSSTKSKVWYDLRKRICKDCGSDLTARGVKKGDKTKYTLYCDKCGHSIDWYTIDALDRDNWFKFKKQPCT